MWSWCSSMRGFEELVSSLVHWLILILEAIGVLIVGVGALIAAVRLLLGLAPGFSADFDRIRLSFARYLVLGLEFQLAVDILSTAVAPSWEQIGRLAVIAVIRTGLNYFLIHEMRMEQKQIRGE